MRNIFSRLLYVLFLPPAAFVSLILVLPCADAQTDESVLFAASSIPAVTTYNDTAAVELGVKFRAAVAGEVVGLRFYKGPQNTGTHVGHLWTSTGTLLGTLTFANETASGWQEARFASPIAITAGTTYVASHFAPVGHYSANSNYFASDYTNGTLTAPSSATAGGNGVYRYANTSSFPNQTYNATNYWVDPIVRTGSGSTSRIVFTDDFAAALNWATAADATWYAGTPKNGTRSVRLRSAGSIDKAIPTGYKGITVSFVMGAYSLDNTNESMRALYYDGASWRLLADIKNNTANENNRLNPYAITLPAAADNIASFKLRFKLNGSATDDYGYVDDVVVRATAISSPAPDTTAPTTPTNLTPLVVSSSQINLAWTVSTDNVGVTGYDVYRNSTLLTTVTGTSYQNTGLAANTTYTYYVRAKDAAGNVSAPSATVSAATPGASVGTVKVYPAPTGAGAIPLYQDFTVLVQGADTPVYTAKVATQFNYEPPPAVIRNEPVGFTTFDIDGAVTAVVAVHNRTVTSAKILPTSAGIVPQVNGNTITIPISKPGKYELLVNSSQRNPLYLFANPMEVNAPHPGESSVLYYGPGVHNIGIKTIGSNTTVYIAGGAIVHGGLYVEGSNATVRGRGILDGSLRPTHTGNMVRFYGSGHTLEGIVITDLPEWTVSLWHVSNVTVDNIKVIAYRQSTDGIDIVSARQIEVKNVFLRNWDDGITVKAVGGVNVDNIRVHDLVIMNDAGSGALEIGKEEVAASVGNIRFENIDTVHSRSMAAIDVSTGDQANIHDVSFSDIRIEDHRGMAGFSQGWIRLILEPDMYDSGQGPGSMNNITFTNVNFMSGELFPSIIAGFDNDTHMIRNVTFNNLQKYGQKVTKWGRDTDVYLECVRSCIQVSMATIASKGTWPM